MHTTTYGYKIPDSGDLSKGVAGWMAASDFNWARLDTHTHDGINSALLTSTNFVSTSVTAASGSWVANAGGTGIPQGGYKQAVTVPAGVTELNDFNIKFYISTAGSKRYQQVFLDYVRVSGTSFTLYCNDNTVDITCVFR